MCVCVRRVVLCCIVSFVGLLVGWFVLFGLGCVVLFLSLYICMCSCLVLCIPYTSLYL